MKKFLLITLLILISSNVSFPQGPMWKIWNTSNSNIPTNILYSIYIDNNHIIWVGSNDHGLIKFDGVNFTSYNTSNSPMKANKVNDIAVDKYGNLWLATLIPGAGNQGALMKYDRANNWSFYNSQNSGISHGNQWCVAVDTNNIVWCFFFKLSKFDGINWTIYDSTNSPLKYSGGREIFVDKLNNKWIGLDFRGLYKLENDANWTYFSPLNSGLGGTEVNKIREDNLGNLWITMSYYGLTKFSPSLNQWQNWTPQNSGIQSGHPWGFYVDKLNTKWLGSGNNDSLGEFNDINFKYNLFQTNTYDIKEDILGNLWLATSSGLIEFNKNGIVGVSDNNSVLNDFELQQNYPNPFNPSTTIKYTLQKSSYIELKIFDVNGKFIKILENGFKQAGSYEINFNSLGMASGIYFYSLIAGNFSETKKMILIK